MFIVVKVATRVSDCSKLLPVVLLTTSPHSEEGFFLVVAFVTVEWLLTREALMAVTSLLASVANTANQVYYRERPLVTLTLYP
jgi:hypothetical protein